MRRPWPPTRPDGVAIAMLLAAWACSGRHERLPVADSPRASTAPPVPQPGAADAPPPRLACTAPTQPTPIELDGNPGWACTEPEGRKSGAFFTLFPDGGTEITGSYRDDLLDGTWRRMFRNGKTAEVGSYVEGKKDGTWQLYADNGGLLGDYQMVHGTGVERRWYFDGQLASERRYADGVLDGPSQVYGNGGTVLYSAQFRAGQLDGPRQIGLPGAMRVEDRWAAGVPQGPRKIWRREFLTLDMKFDSEGTPVGPFTAWRDRSTPRERGVYVRGDRHGVWRWFDRSGALEREGSYFLGLRQGRWREWTAGRLTMQGAYVKGRPHGRFIYWNSLGGVAGTCVMRNGTGTMTTFHDNGQPATKITMVRGLRHGAYRELNPRGRVLVEGTYRDDLRSGAWVERDADGTLLREAGYLDGKLDGRVRTYLKGQLATELTYAAGLREGSYRELRVRDDGREIEVVTGAFHDDQKDGEWIYRAGDGRPALVANYREGVLHGQWQQLAGGQVLVRGQYERGRRSGTWAWTAAAGAGAGAGAGKDTPAGGASRTVAYDRP